MLARLVIGIVKGLIVGGLLGFAIAKLGFVAPGAVVAYLAAAVTGVAIGLVAGKPIWAKDARIEAGMKAVVGALLATGMMYAARRWLTVEVPVSLGELGKANSALGEAAGTNGSLGGLAITSLAMIAALLGGFYEADNDPSDTPAESEKAESAGAGGTRVATSAPEEELAEEEDEAASEKRGKKS